MVFKPSKGNVMTGRVNKVGRHHIGLLVYGVFNVTINAENIPKSFEYDDDSESWISDDSQYNIDFGKEVTFSVEMLHEAAGLISIVGSILAEGTGPSDKPSEPLKLTPIASDRPQPTSTFGDEEGGDEAAEEEIVSEEVVEEGDAEEEEDVQDEGDYVEEEEVVEEEEDVVQEPVVEKKKKKSSKKRKIDEIFAGVEDEKPKKKSKKRKKNKKVKA